MDFSAMWSGFANGPLWSSLKALGTVFSSAISGLMELVGRLFSWIGEKTGLGKYFGSGGGSGHGSGSGGPQQPGIGQDGVYHGMFQYQQNSFAYGNSQLPYPGGSGMSGPGVGVGYGGPGNVFGRMGRGIEHGFVEMGHGIRHGVVATYHAIKGIGGTPLDAAQMHVESADGTLLQSPAGAVGAMGVMPKVADQIGKQQGFVVDHNRLKYDTAYNMDIAKRIRSQMAKEFEGNPDATRLTLAAYNAGPKAVHKALKKAVKSGGDWLSYMPSKETRNYVPKVLEAYNTVSREVPGTNYAAADIPAPLLTPGMHDANKSQVPG